MTDWHPTLAGTLVKVIAPGTLSQTRGITTGDAIDGRIPVMLIGGHWPITLAVTDLKVITD